RSIESTPATSSPVVFFFLSSAAPRRSLPSFPTRRSSDLDTLITTAGSSSDLGWQTLPENGSQYRAVIQRLATGGLYQPILLTVRSEEHTSELQSRSDLVCRLLLEKKKQRHPHVHEAQVLP